MYIGLTGYNHESSAALVDSNGFLIDFYREESLSRIKGDKSFPKRSLDRLLKHNHINVDEIINVTFYERPLSAFITILKTAGSHLPESLPLISHQCRNFNKSSVACYSDIGKLFPGLEKKLVYCDHHLSHTLTSLAYSNNQKNLCSIVVDGFGDRSTSSISIVNNHHQITELWSSVYPISLGLFYSAITDFLGFQVNEGEYKVMGLSSFGNKDSAESKKVLSLIEWDDKNNNIVQDMSYFKYHISPEVSFSSKLVELLGNPRNPFKTLLPEDKEFQYYANIAKGAQLAVSNILCKIFKFAFSLTDCNEFLFSGGVAMNSASLDELASLDFVKKITLPPSPGDSGSAIGAAYYSYLKNNTKKNIYLPKPSLFPSKYNCSDQKKLAEKIINSKFKIITSSPTEIINTTAELISKGKVVGTILENSETGPRALGNRSLICDGKNKDAVQFLNTIIKKRSPFRPTAPCMQEKAAKKYYVIRNELMECYKTMSATCKCKENSEAETFPTTHVDKTARIQIVEEGQFLNELLNELKNYSIDILANSSLNLSGDPTSFDLIDTLMISSRSPLEYIVSDFGVLKVKQ